MQPETIDVDKFFVLELESPFTTMFVLYVFPFGFDAGFEEVVIGF